MSITEFQELLKSDQVQKNKELEKQIKGLDEEIKKKDGLLRTLFNRCYTDSQKETCWFCSMVDECKKLREVSA